MPDRPAIPSQARPSALLRGAALRVRPRPARRAAAVLAGLAALALVPAAVSAHPLGNFTINHYAGIRIQPSAVVIDFVIDEAEIPAFQDRARLDADADGDVSPAEAAAAAPNECARLAASATLTVGGAAVALVPTAAGLSFPPGAAGLVTMRTACLLVGTLAAPLVDGTPIAFADGSFPERIGWREIVVEGDGATVNTDLPATSRSDRLTSYPTDLLTQPLDIRTASFQASPGGPSLPPPQLPDAMPIAGAASVGQAPVTPPTATAASSAGGAVPGGVGAEISGLLSTTDMTPFVLIASLLTALALGAGHALTPGHGKTIMAAYLVGTRGTPLHALGLGLSVTVSHTIGILVLAGVVVAAGETLPPERFQQIAPALSAIVVLVIGAWMVAGQIRRRWAGRRITMPVVALAGGTMSPVMAMPGGAVADGAELHEHAGEHEHQHEHADEHPHPHDHPHPHEHPHPHDHRAADHGDIDGQVVGEHSHGGRRHSHVPADPASMSWKSLVALGLAGGLVPSTNALLILLATVATGRAAYGLILVVAFGVGMALVLGGIGLMLVLARDRVEGAGGMRLPRRLLEFAPAAASVLVLGLGIYLTAQALGGSFVL